MTFFTPFRILRGKAPVCCCISIVIEKKGFDKIFLPAIIGIKKKCPEFFLRKSEPFPPLQSLISRCTEKGSKKAENDMPRMRRRKCGKRRNP